MGVVVDALGFSFNDHTYLYQGLSHGGRKIGKPPLDHFNAMNYIKQGPNMSQVSRFVSP